MRYKLGHAETASQKAGFIIWVFYLIVFLFGTGVYAKNIYEIGFSWVSLFVYIGFLAVMGGTSQYTMAIFGIFAFILVGIHSLIKRIIRPFRKEKLSPKAFLKLGWSTGALADKNHVQGLQRGQDIYLTKSDCCQNFLCLGGIGSGKTTRFMIPVLIQFFTYKLGGLIFNIKGDFNEAVEEVHQKTGHDYVTVGVGQNDYGLNLIQGVSPELAATYLRSVFMLEGGGRDSAFWVDTAVQLCQNSLSILRLAGSYDLSSLYRFIFFERFRNEAFLEAEKNATNDKDRLIFENCKDYHFEVYEEFDDKTKKNVGASVSQVLAGFQNPDFVEAFCSNVKPQVNIEDCLNGQVVLVNLPIAEYGATAKAVYTLIKLRFFSLVQQRATRADLNRDSLVFLMGDEYQEIISASKSGISDLNFWDKSRSNNCIGVISAQSINSFHAAIGDNRLADTILQNFRQKVTFRTEDTATIRYFQDLAGKAEVERTSHTSGSSHSSTHGYSVSESASFSSSSSSGSSSSSTLSLQERSVIDGQLVRSMSTDYGLCFLNIDGISYDDILHFEPSFHLLSR